MKLTILLLLITQICFAQDNSVIVIGKNDTVSYNAGGIIQIGRTTAGIPFKSDLLLNFSTRSGGYLIDEINGDTAKILTREFISINSTITGDDTRKQEYFLNGTSCTIYSRVTMVNKITSNLYNYLWGTGGYTQGYKGFALYTQGVGLKAAFSDGGSDAHFKVFTLLDSTNCRTKLLPLDYFDAIVVYDNSANTITVDLYDPDGDKLITTQTQSTSDWGVGDVKNAGDLTFGSPYFAVQNFKKYAAVKTLNQCQDYNDTTSLQIYMPNVFSTVDIKYGYKFNSSVGYPTTGNYTYVCGNSYLLDKGYTKYQEDYSTYVFDYYIPNNIGKQEVSFTLANYIKTNYVSDSSTHNMLDSKIRFTNAFFDRSNATIWTDSCRNSSYYSSTNTKDFHINELDYRLLRYYLHDGYGGKFYPRIQKTDYLGNFYASFHDSMSITSYQRKKIDKLLLYNTDKSSANNLRVLQYTGDYRCAIKSGNSYTYDSLGYVALGYLQTTKPMFVIRLDDGLATQESDWKNFFDTVGVKPILSLTTELLGTAGYIGWDDVIDLHNAGWEIGGHGLNDESMEDSSYTYISGAIPQTKQMIIDSSAIIPINFTPHKYGHNNLSVRKLALDYFRSCHAGYQTAIESANPREITIDNLRALRGDISGNFNLDNPTGIANVKIELDDAATNNKLVIIFVHGYVEAIADGLYEVIKYAQANGIDIVTLNEALNNCKYLSK